MSPSANSYYLHVSSHIKSQSLTWKFCKAMVSANIPFNKLSNLEFWKCLEDYCGKDIPTESVLRMFYLDDCYN